MVRAFLYASMLITSLLSVLPLLPASQVAAATKSTTSTTSTTGTSGATGTSNSDAAVRTILVFGDSLSAGYGLKQTEGWVTLLAERLRREKFNYNVANASVSGETSAGGASRIDQVLAQYRPNIVVLELGSNDGLRGLPISQMKANLTRIIRASQKQGAQVLIVGNRMPPNYGMKYTEDFYSSFPQLAKEFNSRLVPFFLSAIILNLDYFQPDNLHPTAAAQKALLETVWSELKPLLKQSS